jgi:DNA repair protein RadA/Sms
MKKERTKYVCQSCGYTSPKWMGKCSECGAWNAFIEEKVEPVSRLRAGTSKVVPKSVLLKDIEEPQLARIKTGTGEFDRVLGGGIVIGSIILVGGAPGIGKSTLLLQVCSKIANQGKKVLYISGEESLQQIKLRADRLSIRSDNLKLLSETDLESIASVFRIDKPDFCVVDSIQTVHHSQLESLPGNVSQVRTCGYTLSVVAKEEQIPVFLVGHVTKEGSIAGPRVLEHLVDGLLLMEGDEQHAYRLLRAVKNRFGSTNEIGLFEMTDKGIMEVAHPSEYLLSYRHDGTSGSVVTVSLEGTRPLLVEVQALVASTSYGIPQRITTGIEHRRLAILLAVLEKRVGLKFGTQDVFVNAAGGLHIREPAVDLAVSIAVASSLKDRPIDPKVTVVGEVGLSGEVRGVSQIERRIVEVERLGFKKLILPNIGLSDLQKKTKLQLMGVQCIREAVQKLTNKNGI